MNWIYAGGIGKFLQHGKFASFNNAGKCYREVIQARDSREWSSRYSVFKRVVREYAKNYPPLDIVRYSEGYRIVEKMLV